MELLNYVFLTKDSIKKDDDRRIGYDKNGKVILSSNKMSEGFYKVISIIKDVKNYTICKTEKVYAYDYYNNISEDEFKTLMDNRGYTLLFEYGREDLKNFTQLVYFNTDNNIVINVDVNVNNDGIRYIFSVDIQMIGDPKYHLNMVNSLVWSSMLSNNGDYSMLSVRFSFSYECTDAPLSFTEEQLCYKGIIPHKWEESIPYFGLYTLDKNEKLQKIIDEIDDATYPFRDYNVTAYWRAYRSPNFDKFKTLFSSNNEIFKDMLKVLDYLSTIVTSVIHNN